MITSMSTEKELEKLGGNLKRIRLEQGLSQTDVAEKLSVDKSYISNIEAGRQNLTVATLTRLAKALKVSSDELLK